MTAGVTGECCLWRTLGLGYDLLDVEALIRDKIPIMSFFFFPVVNLFSGKTTGLRTGLQKLIKSTAFLIGVLSFKGVGEQYDFSGFWRIGSFWNRTSKSFQVLQILFFKGLCLEKAVFLFNVVLMCENRCLTGISRGFPPPWLSKLNFLRGGFLNDAAVSFIGCRWAHACGAAVWHRTAVTAGVDRTVLGKRRVWATPSSPCFRLSTAPSATFCPQLISLDLKMEEHWIKCFFALACFTFAVEHIGRRYFCHFVESGARLTL